MRDLEADRRFVDSVAPMITPETDILRAIADAALDEIARLKGLCIVEIDPGDWRHSHGWRFKCLVGDESCHSDEASAWAAVRKAANDGK